MHTDYFPFPKTTIVLKNKGLTEFNLLKEQLIQKNEFKIITFLGEKSVIYIGEIECGIISFTRDIGFAMRLPIYPNAYLALTKSSLDIEIKITLTIYWKLLFYFFYTILVTGLIFKLTRSDSTMDSMFTILKAIGSVTILYLMIYGYHLSESKNILKIVSDAVNNE